MAVGRVGRTHGTDGSFYVDHADPAFPDAGASVFVAGTERAIERRAGTPSRPLIRLAGSASREETAALRGEVVTVAEADAPLEEGEWLIEDLVGCRVDGLGTVRTVISGPSCDVLEVGDDRVLVPLISDAVLRIDAEAGEIEVDLRFLGLNPEPDA